MMILLFMCAGVYICSIVVRDWHCFLLFNDYCVLVRVVTIMIVVCVTLCLRVFRFYAQL